MLAGVWDGKSDETVVIYITGYTLSVDFPVVTGPYPNNSGGLDAFVSKLNPTGSDVVFSTDLEVVQMMNAEI